MVDLLKAVEETLRDAMSAVAGIPPHEIDPIVHPSKHADAQANGCIALAKRVGCTPAELAQKVAEYVNERN